MFKYFISLIKYLPEIKDFEHQITKRFYWLASPNTVKEVLQGIHNPRHFNDIEEEELILLINTVNVLKGVFKKMPLKLQLEHIFDINSYRDTCTYFEQYMINARASQSVLVNRILISYAEIILPQLKEDQKGEFLEKLHKNIRTGGFMGAKYYEEDELAIIMKWQLENELTKNPIPKPKKVIKL